jgi:predicted ester cyclase
MDVVRRLFTEVINEGKFNIAEEITTPMAVPHVPFLDPGRGAAALITIAKSLRTGFPDIQIAIEDLFAVDDKVVARWRTTRQTHTGRYRGVPPTGRSIQVTAIQIFRFEGDRIAELWLELDQMGAARQLGVVPAEEAPPAGKAVHMLCTVVRMVILEAKDGLSHRRTRHAS